LAELIAESCRPRKARRPTRPTLSSKRKRLDKKQQRGTLKAQRRPVRRGDE